MFSYLEAPLFELNVCTNVGSTGPCLGSGSVTLLFTNLPTSKYVSVFFHMTSSLWGTTRSVYTHRVTLQSAVLAALPYTRFGMCPMEYLRYCSSRMHFPPYYLSNNS